MSVGSQTEPVALQCADDERYEFSRRAGLAQGQPIGNLMAQALQFPDLISLAAGFVDNATLPCEAAERCLQRLCADHSKLRRALQYDATAGNLELRKCIAEWSHRAQPEFAPEPERIILTSGSNQFLHLLAEAIINPGDIVLVAAPTYFVFLGTLKGIDAQVVGVRADQDGICIDALRERMEQIALAGDAPRLKAIYLVTDFDNPGGSTLSLSRRQELIEVVSRWRKQHGSLLLISDNAYHLLRYRGEPLPALSSFDAQAEEYIVELGTFSKCFSPGIRVGWGVVPSYLVERLLEMKSNVDFGSPHFNQVLMQEAITSGEVDRHLPTIRDAYECKLNAMLDALQASFGADSGVSWRRPSGGLYVWLTLPEHMDASESGSLWPAAVQRGVLYVPGHYCYPELGEGVARNTIRLSFGVQDPAGITDGIRRLADAIASQ
jgi:2-aminoadipate transaminase